MTRAGVGGLVVVAWLLVLAWNARREYFRPEAERLALGAATLPPGVAYYRIDAGERPAGMASIEIDTLPGRRGFVLREQYVVRLPGLGAAGETEIRAETWLGPGVTLDSLHRRTIRGGDTVRVRAVVRRDSLRWEGPADTVVRSLSGDAVVQTAASWPLRFVAAGGAGTDDVRRLTLLDPVSGDLRDVELRTLEVAARVFADSADTDSVTGEWIVAGRDSVEAWHLERTDRPAGDAPGSRTARFDAWVDEDGRYVEADLAAGLRLHRTAFELAFFRGAPRSPAPAVP